MLAAYVEGLLTGHEKSRMEAHLSACDACLEEFKLTRSIVSEKAQFDPDTVPAAVTQSAVRLVKGSKHHGKGSVGEKNRRVSQHVAGQTASFFPGADAV